MRVAIALLVVPLGLSCASEEPAAVDSSGLGSQQIGLISTLNTADLPRRCPPEDQDWQIVPTCSGDMTCDPAAYPSTDDFWLDTVLLGDMKYHPTFINFQYQVDYYGRRDIILQKFAEKLEAMPESQRILGIENYSATLVYHGDFEKEIEEFGPGGPREASTQTDPYLTFDVAHAFFRLGRYAESLPYASRAHRWLPGFDTKWQLMLTEVHLYGRDFFDKYSKDQYDTKHVLDSFPERDSRNLPFVDATEEMGILREDRFGGYGAVAWADFDNDGWDDLMFERKLFPFRVYRNVEGKRLEYIGDENMGGAACSHMFSTPTDVDNDGKLDITRNCCNYDSQGDMIQLKNVSRGVGAIGFEDVTEKAGLVRDLAKYPQAGWGMNVSYGDLDLDGDLDALVADFLAPARVYQNQGDGTFKDVHAEIGINTPGSATQYGGLGLSMGDLDNDGWPDVFAQGWGWRRLYKNKKDGTFEDVTERAGVDAGKDVKGYISFTFDYNNDNQLDLFAGAFVTSDQTQLGVEKLCGCHKLLTPEGYSPKMWSQASTVYKNAGNFTFENIGQKTKFVPFGAMGANYGDWNNDEYADVVICSGGPYTQQAEPFQFYENQRGTGNFASRTPWTELGLWGKGHGSAFNDFDRDGDLDVMLNSGGFQPGDQWPSSLLRNVTTTGHWLQVGFKASRPGTNRDAQGTRVEIYYGDGRVQVREHWLGIGFASTNGSRVHFGLGEHDRIDRMTVRWPNRDFLTHKFNDIDVDQAIEIDEASGSMRTLWASPR